MFGYTTLGPSLHGMMLTGTVGKDKRSLEEAICGIEVGNDGKAEPIGAVEGGCEQVAVFGTEAGNGDKAGLIGVAEGGCE